MKIAIVGSRTITDYSLLEQIWNKLKLNHDSHIIISGAANGVDKIARDFALNNNLGLVEYRAEWEKYGKSAGFIRNKTIINECEICIAIWDGESKGTAHDIRLCKEMKKRLYLYNTKPGKRILHEYKYDI